MARMVRLYRAEWSTNCERVGMALAHKGLEAESVLITYEDRSPSRPSAARDWSR